MSLSIKLNPETKKYDIQFRVKDGNGDWKKSTKRGFKTKKEAEQWLNEHEKKVGESLEMKFRDYVELYLEDMKPRLRETTYFHKELYFRVHITPFFGKYEMGNITIAMVRNWQREIMAKGFAPTYLKTLNNQLTALFNHAVRYHGLKDNPASKAGTIGKEHGEEVEFYTKDEFELLIAQLLDDQTSYTIFMTFYYTGMRIGELTALNVGDIHLDEKYIDINKSKSVVNGKEIINPPKTPKSKRKVTLPDFMVKVLSEYIDTLYNPKTTTRLFPVSKSAIERDLKRAAKQAGLRKLKVHSLRHAHASYLIEMGVPILAISNRLGHEKIQTTINTYGHLYPNKQREIADAINAKYLED